MKINIVGVGQRGVGYIKYIKKCFDINIVNGIYDVNKIKMDFVYKKYNLSCVKFKSLDDCLNDKSEYIFICTPDNTHFKIACACLQHNKHILIEKPICLNYHELKILDKLKMKSNIFIPLILQYTDLYNEIKNNLHKLGKINKIHLNLKLSKIHTASYHRRWHRFTKYSGGFINSKCCHDISLLCWLIDKKPNSVFTYGSKSLFDNENIKQTNCKSCSLQCEYRFDGKYVVDVENTTNDLCVYNSNSEIVDNQTVLLNFKCGLIIILDINMNCVVGDRLLTIYGNDGILKSSFANNNFNINLFNNNDDISIKFNNKIGHNGGDVNFLKEIFKKTGKDILYEDGKYSIYLCNMIERSLNNNINIELNT